MLRGALAVLQAPVLDGLYAQRAVQAVQAAGPPIKTRFLMCVLLQRQLYENARCHPNGRSRVGALHRFHMLQCGRDKLRDV